MIQVCTSVVFLCVGQNENSASESKGEGKFVEKVLFAS